MARAIKRATVGSAAAICLMMVAACGSEGDSGGSSGRERVATAEDMKGRTLNVVSWGGAWTDATKKYFADPFSEETGVKVEFQVAGNDVTAPVLLQEQQGAVTIDLVDGGAADQLEDRGFAAHFPDDLMATLRETSRPEAVGDYVLGFGDTATLIVCNPTIVEKCPTNAAEFWDVENFPGDRAIASTYASALPFALLADGVAPDDLFPMDVDRAISKLEEIKPHVKVWPDSGAMQEQILIDKEVGIAYIWNGRAFLVKNKQIPELELNWDDSVVGSGGGYVVPKNAPDADVAFAFLEWIAEHPEAQAGWTDTLTYGMPAKNLIELVSPNVAEALPEAHDPAIIPGSALAKQDSEIQKAWQSFLTS